ncbi:hypothetical protein A2476_05790 [candidate division CPR3 bacterium RIFOXYC2_FULL_35_7]|nr:MAG: hypothetical protein A2476_05790 [candidate division CPR3 bacterium RIFOXYC2_FULL_35_7]
MAPKRFTITKKVFDEIMSIDDMVSGVVFQTDREFILNNFKEAGVSLVKKRLKEFVDVNYNSFNIAYTYPGKYRVLIMSIVKELFNLSAKDMADWGTRAVHYSLFIKVVARYFISLDTLIKTASSHYSRQHSAGKFVVKSINKSKGVMEAVLKDCITTDVYCEYLSGYIAGLVSLVTPNKKVKCSYKRLDSFSTLFTVTYSGKH